MSYTSQISIQGHSLVAETYNPGAPGFPVLLLHGVMSSLPFWTTDLIEPFLPYGPCTALSLPGHYPATCPPGFGPADLTAERIAALLHAALQNILKEQGFAESQQVLVVGHSTGGFAALALAIFFPQSIRGVASIAGFAQGRWGSWLRIYQWLARRPKIGSVAMRSLLRAGSFRPLFRASAAFHTPLPRAKLSVQEQDRLMEENYQAFRNYDADAMQAYFTAMHAVDILPQLSSIRAPVLAICGDADLAVPPVQSRRIANSIPGAELVIIRGGVGHMPFYQKSSVYRKAMDGWLHRHFSGRETPAPDS